MKKNIIISIETLVIIVFTVVYVITMNSNNRVDNSEVTAGSIESYQDMIDGYKPVEGYVPDAQAAISIAEAVFSTMDIKGGEYIVEYDKSEQMWIIQNVSIFRQPSYVIINKSDREIIRAWKTK